MQTPSQPTDASLALPFGKYKDRPVQVIQQTDPQYIEWLIQQAWFKEKFPSHFTLIINQGAANENTPAHNAMQALFLDDAICHKTIAATRPGLFKNLECCTLEFMLPKVERNNKGWQSEEKSRAHLLPGASREWSDATYEGTKHRTVTSTPATLVGAKVGRNPEYKGWDWVLRASFGCSVCRQGVGAVHVSPAFNRISDRVNIESVTLGVELKPTLGDDYPAVLRQIQQHGNLGQSWVYGYSALIVGRYTGEGASFDQVKEIFKAAQISVVLLEDVQRCELI